MTITMAPAERQRRIGEWRRLQPYTVRVDRDGVYKGGDGRVADRDAPERPGAAHWELDGTYYLG